MIVYRVENKAGCGPYFTRGSWYGRKWIADSHKFTEHTPSAYLDVDGFERGMLCGFTSLEDLYTWFDGWLDLLIFSGFKVVEYDVVGVLEGEKQVCFVLR